MMIVGIGTDIIEIDRIKKAITKETFRAKCFTKVELALFESRKNNPEVLAGNFAVKESVSKVLGTGFRAFALTDIEVLRDELGKPYVNLYNGAKEQALALKINRVHVSISHSKEYAIGYAIGECE